MNSFIHFFQRPFAWSPWRVVSLFVHKLHRTLPRNGLNLLKTSTIVENENDKNWLFVTLFVCQDESNCCDRIGKSHLEYLIYDRMWSDLKLRAVEGCTYLCLKFSSAKSCLVQIQADQYKWLKIQRISSKLLSVLLRLM